MIFQVRDLAKSFGARELFRGVSWSIHRGDRVGLVGPNGVGKTTLLRIFCGRAHADAGEVVLPRQARVGYLAQEISRVGAGTVLEETLRGAPELTRMEARLRELEAALGEAGEEDAHRLAEEHAELFDRFQHAGGHEVESRAREILAGLGLGASQLDRPVSELSGGWAMRVLLASLLLSEPDLLLLDEPTNHLDLESLEWLEGFLEGYPGAWVVVSHDRYFLDRMVSRIAELTADGLYVYEGNYDDYLETREAVQARLEKEAAAHARRVKEVQAFIDRFRAKATKARQAQSRVKLLERMEAEQADAPKVRGPKKSLALRLPEPERSGEVVATLEGVGKAYGDNVVYRGLDLTIRRGEKVALLGVNGAGKSTLLRLLAGSLSPDEGKRELGHKVTAFHFAQHQAEALDPEVTVVEVLREVMPAESESRVRGILGAFLFSGDDVEKKVKVLSGGEKSRLALARMLARPANLLLLDEPTNHLDLDSRAVLESALGDFPGTVVCISHDRYFINRVCDCVLEVRRPGIVERYPGNYDYYEWKRAAEREASLARAAETPDASRDESKEARKEARREERARQRAEQRAVARREKERTRLEAAIARVESRVHDIDALLCAPEVHADGERTRALLEERSRLEAELPELYEAWTGLSADDES